ncbi:MAG: hypothetical protein A4E53_01110 [Pelotomaculum sp. PtaB.Bin104]|nr:MAG: hypothetical protein A4E53_01110 [Pelotomaculum sp. PtaB.Bin104]
MAKVLRMSFKNEGGNTVSISLDAPKETLTAAEVEAAMDLVITKNIFTSSGGNLVAKSDAKIIDTTVTDLYTPA